MKKSLFLLALIAMFLFVLSGCKKDQPSEEPVLAGEVTIIVYNNNSEEVFNRKLQFMSDDTLLELLQNNEDVALKGENSQFGFYITEMCGINANNYQNTYWSIMVNGEYSLVGISDLGLKDQDVIEFILTAY